MSWFSNPFRASETQQIDSDGDDGGEYTHGVKEDLSELTKTFARQLWGVASFLAPPPQAKSQDASSDEGGDDEASMAPRSHQSPIKQGDRPLITEEMDLSEELVDVDFEALMDETLEDKPAETSKGENLVKNQSVEPAQRSVVHLPDQQSLNILEQHGLTGISRDLAELKGSVASGFSRILRVVREEIEQEETSKSHEDDTDDEDDEMSARSTNARNLHGINTFFRPLISNILHDDGGKKDAHSDDEEEEEEEEEEGDEDDLRKDYGHRTFQPARKFNLHDTFLHGFKGISELASSLIPVSLNSDDENGAHEQKRSLQVVGITEEVLAFARNISMHPETWLDFPLFQDINEGEEFKMSVAQKEHVHALELASPGLSALKTELCPDCMSEGCFWKIYFVLLHSRLGKMDAELLSTHKIMEARVHLLRKLQEGEAQESKSGRKEKEKNTVGMASSASGTSRTCKFDSLQSAMGVPLNNLNQAEDAQTNQGRLQTSSVLTDSVEEVQNKNVLADTVKLATSSYEGEEKDAERWLTEEPLPHVPSAAAGLRDEDDVSFSDLEDDDDTITKDVRRSDSTQSFGWVQLNKNQSVEDFEGLRGSERSGLQGSRHGDIGQSSAQVSRKQDQSESSDWSTVEEDDAAGSDFM